METKFAFTSHFGGCGWDDISRRLFRWKPVPRKSATCNNTSIQMVVSRAKAEVYCVLICQIIQRKSELSQAGKRAALWYMFQILNMTEVFIAVTYALLDSLACKFRNHKSSTKKRGKNELVNTEVTTIAVKNFHSRNRIVYYKNCFYRSHFTIIYGIAQIHREIINAYIYFYFLTPVFPSVPKYIIFMSVHIAIACFVPRLVLSAIICKPTNSNIYLKICGFMLIFVLEKEQI